MSTGKSTVQAQAEPFEDGGFAPDGPFKVLEGGKTLMRAGTPFVTAISVQKPRNLDKIVEAIDREAQYAGDSFYYAWTDKKGNRIEGPSIGLANSLAREWTNCAVTVDFQETDGTFILTPRFVDIEKGFQMERVFRQRKNVVQGNFDPDRKLDMALQIGQSKAIRNVVVNAVPRWLVDRAIEKAKEAVVKGLDPQKLQEYADSVMSYFTAKKTTPEQVIAKAGKEKALWSLQDIAAFKGDKNALEKGEATITELFPPIDPKKEVEGPITGKAIADALVPDKPAETTPKADPSTISPEEAKRIRDKEVAEAQGEPKKAAPPPPAKGGAPQKPKGEGLFG